MNFNEAKFVNGLIQSEAHKMRKKEGRTHITKDDHAAATQVICGALDIDPAETLREIGRHMLTHKTGRPRKQQPEQLEIKQTETPNAPDITTRRQLYYKWVEENDWVPHDTVIAFFTGLDRTNFSQVRRILMKRGFEFSKNGHGYNITRAETDEQRKAREEAEAEAKRKAAINAQIAAMMAELEALKAKL